MTVAATDGSKAYEGWRSPTPQDTPLTEVSQLSHILSAALEPNPSGAECIERDVKISLQSERHPITPSPTLLLSSFLLALSLARRATTGFRLSAGQASSEFKADHTSHSSRSTEISTYHRNHIAMHPRRLPETYHDSLSPLSMIQLVAVFSKSWCLIIHFRLFWRRTDQPATQLRTRHRTTYHLTRSCATSPPVQLNLRNLSWLGERRTRHCPTLGLQQPSSSPTAMV